MGDVLPKKIHEQLERKYEDGHRLEVLIQSHRDSLCKEPRDHIYGFVGLATDCVDGFPMGYEKSLYEVWKDVIRFKNLDNTSSQLDILGFGRLVQDLLGGKDIATPAEVADDIPIPRPTTFRYSTISWYEGLLRVRRMKKYFHPPKKWRNGELSSTATSRMSSDPMQGKKASCSYNFWKMWKMVISGKFRPSVELSVGQL
jgi:hypothetical protein